MKSEHVEIPREGGRQAFSARFLLLIILFSMTIGISIGINEVSDPFLYWNIALVEICKQGGLLGFERLGMFSFSTLGYNPGYTGMLLALSTVAGMSPEILQFLPIGSVFLPIVFFSVCRKLLGLNPETYLLTLFVVTSDILVILHTTFVYMWGVILFLSFILFHLQFRQGNMMRSNIVASVLLLSGLVTIHWTFPFWVIVFLASSMIFSHGVEHKLTKLLLAFVILYLVFENVIYEIVLPRLGHLSFEDLPLFAKLASYITGHTVASERYIDLTIQPPAVGWLRISIYLLILVPLSLDLLSHIRSSRRTGRKASQHDLTIFGYSVLVVGVADVLAYATYGGISVKYILLMFPILAVTSLHKLLKRKAFIIAMTVAMLILSICSFCLSFNVITVGSTKYDRIEPFEHWMAGKTNVSSILSDADTFGKILVLASRQNSSLPRYISYTSQAYEEVMEEKTYTESQYFKEGTCLVINLKSINYPITAVGGSKWKSGYQSLCKYICRIHQNPNLDKVYDSGGILALVPSQEG